MINLLFKNAAQHTMNLEKASISNLTKALSDIGEGSLLKGADAEEVFRGVNLVDGSAALQLHNVLKKGASKGQYYDEATMQGIVRNIGAGDDAFLGVTPGAMSGSAFLNNIAGQGSAGGQAMAMLGLGVMAGGANTMMGGDFSEGAVVGALGGATVAGLARGLAKSGTNLTDDVLEKALGKKFMKEQSGEKVVQEEIAEKLVPGSTKYTDSDLYFFQGTGQGGKPVTDAKDVVFTTEQKELAQKANIELEVRQQKRAEKFIDPAMPNIPQTVLVNEGALVIPKGSRGFTKQQVTLQEFVPELKQASITPQQARQMNLETFETLGDEELKRANLTAAQRDAMLETNPEKKGNVAMRNRMLTLGGGMLSGVAFTSRKRDHRRGFNKRRGNRI